MNNKQDLLVRLREVFEGSEELLASMSEEQIAALLAPSNWSIKDVIARLEVALANEEPELPKWLNGLDPESEEHREEFNARIYEGYREESWLSVHRAWREGFLRSLSLGEAIPEEYILDAERYLWLKGYSLSAVLHGSYEHHQEHLQPLLPWLRQHRKMNTSGSNGATGGSKRSRKSVSELPPNHRTRSSCVAVHAQCDSRVGTPRQASTRYAGIDNVTVTGRKAFPFITNRAGATSARMAQHPPRST